jgi:hypothetical protein
VNSTSRQTVQISRSAIPQYKNAQSTMCHHSDTVQRQQLEKNKNKHRINRISTHQQYNQQVKNDQYNDWFGNK